MWNRFVSPSAAKQTSARRQRCITKVAQFSAMRNYCSDNATTIHGGHSFLLVSCRGVASLVSCGARIWRSCARLACFLSISSSSLLPLPHVSVHRRTVKGLPSESYTPAVGEPNQYRHFLFISPMPHILLRRKPITHGVYILEGGYHTVTIVFLKMRQFRGIRLITKTENKTFFLLLLF